MTHRSQSVPLPQTQTSTPSQEGKSVGIHLEPGPDGGLVMLDDTTVLDRALKILDELNMSMQKEQATESVQV